MILMNREEDIRAAVSSFEKLLREQIDRSDRISEESTYKSKESEKTVIGLIDGDGIGPIIMKEAKKLLEKLNAFLGGADE